MLRTFYFSPRTTAFALIAAAFLVDQGACFAAGKKRGGTPAPTRSLYFVEPGYTETGIASWYGGRDVGRKTANGETYRANDVTAAHKKLPFNTLVRVTNINNGKNIVVRINDRGPYIRGRIIDLSEISAKKIGVYDRGISRVKIEVVRVVPIMEKPNLRLPAAAPRASPKPAPKPPTRKRS